MFKSVVLGLLVATVSINATAGVVFVNKAICEDVKQQSLLHGKVFSNHGYSDELVGVISNSVAKYVKEKGEPTDVDSFGYKRIAANRFIINQGELFTNSLFFNLQTLRDTSSAIIITADSMHKACIHTEVFNY